MLRILNYTPRPVSSDAWAGILKERTHAMDLTQLEDDSFLDKGPHLAHWGPATPQVFKAVVAIRQGEILLRAHTSWLLSLQREAWPRPFFLTF